MIYSILQISRPFHEIQWFFPDLETDLNFNDFSRAVGTLNRAPLLCCTKLCASFHSHQWIQTGVTVRKSSIVLKIPSFFSRVTLKLNGWPSKIIGHLFCATSSLVHHFVAISDFKVDSQSGNAQFGSNWTIFLAVWPWNFTDDLEKQQGTSSMLLQALCIIS